MKTPGDSSGGPSLGSKLLAGSILLTAATFLGLLGDLPHLPLMVGAGLVPAWCRRRPLPVSDRSVTYSILLAIMVATTLGYFYPLERGHLGLFSYFFRPEYYAAYALNLAVVSCYFPSRQIMAGTSLGAAVFVLGSCGDADPFSLENSRFIWGSGWVTGHYSQVYAGVVAVVLLLGLWLLQLSRPASVRGQPPLRLWRLLPLFSLSCLALSLWGTFLLHHRYERAIRDLERSFIAAGGRSLWRSRVRTAPMFSDEIDLNLPFPLGGDQDERRIVLRAVAESAPGYLRARAFSRYERGRWIATKESQPLPLDRITAGGLLALSRFQRVDRAAAADDRRCELFYAGNLRSEKLPVPAPFVGLELIADGMWANVAGELTPLQWKRDGGYIVFAPRRPLFASAFDLPVAGEEDLQVPDELRAALASAIGAISGLAEAASDHERLARLQHHFARHFRYRLGGEPEPPEANATAESQSGSRHSCAVTEVPDDPVMTFLVATRSGHCELFAAAAVLLLRQSGVPARYVTGFLCHERHPSGSYYLSRLGHAHAWVEAYDRDAGGWRLFDPTPASGRRDYADGWNLLSAGGDRLRHVLRQVLASIQRGQIAEAWLIVLRWMWSVLVHPLGLTLLSVGIGGWGWRHWRRRRLPLVRLNAGQRRAAADYRRLSRHWQKRLRLESSDSRTARELLQLAARAPGVSAAELAALADAISRYEQVRFGGRPAGSVVAPGGCSSVKIDRK